MTQAFQGTTLVLRKQLENEGLEGLDFICSPSSTSKISLILRSEVCQKNAINFKVAIVLNFFKTDLNGESTSVQPVFTSSNVYLNNVSEVDVEAILSEALSAIKDRFEDFVGKGSGMLVYYT